MPILRVLSQVVQKGLCVLCLTIALCTSLSLWQPSIAAPLGSNQLTAEEKLDRAYDVFGEDAGIREEIVQDKLDQGEDLEKEAKPYRRITDLKGQEVPETSLVETTVSKVRNLVEHK